MPLTKPITATPDRRAEQNAAAPGSARFCPSCGDAWNELWVDCPRCAVRSRRRHAAAADHGRIAGGIGSALALYFALLATSALALLGGRAGFHGVGVVMAVQVVDALIVLGWCFADRKDVLPALQTTPSVQWYPLAAGAALLTFAAASLSVSAMQLFAGPTHAHSYSDPFLVHGYGWATVVLSVCIQPAIFEELAFRGVILAGLRRLLNNREAVFVSAGMFMVLHLSVLSFPHLLLIGIALGYLRVRTGSLCPGMVLHFSHNLLCVVWEHIAR